MMSRRGMMAGLAAVAPATAVAMPAIGDDAELAPGWDARRRFDYHVGELRKAARDPYVPTAEVHIDVEFYPEERRSRPHPDAELLELEKEFEKAKAAYDAIDAIQQKMEFDHEDWGGALQDVWDAIGDILAAPARTMTGLRIKARAVWWQVDGDWTNPHRGAGLDGGAEYPLASFLRDLLPEDADTLDDLMSDAVATGWAS